MLRVMRQVHIVPHQVYHPCRSWGARGGGGGVRWGAQLPPEEGWAGSAQPGASAVGAGGAAAYAWMASQSANLLFLAGRRLHLRAVVGGWLHPCACAGWAGGGAHAPESTNANSVHTLCHTCSELGSKWPSRADPGLHRLRASGCTGGGREGSAPALRKLGPRRPEPPPSGACIPVRQCGRAAGKRNASSCLQADLRWRRTSPPALVLAQIDLHAHSEKPS